MRRIASASIRNITKPRKASSDRIRVLRAAPNDCGVADAPGVVRLVVAGTNSL
jgi:hypothetical protein